MKNYTIHPIPLWIVPMMHPEGPTLPVNLAVFYVWYIEGANSRILVDAGWEETGGIEMGAWKISSLDNGLARVGLRPEEVEIVIFTHLHPDWQPTVQAG